MESLLASVLDIDGLDQLIKIILSEGYEIIGPVAENGVIGKGIITSAEDLPRGYHDMQAPGSYTLTYDPSAEELFAWAVGPASFKDSYFPPKQTLFSGKITKDKLTLSQSELSASKRCFFGIRPCEVAAIGILGHVMTGGLYQDPVAVAAENALVIAVECGSPAETCFCSSFDTGPMANKNCDLVITEITAENHRFLIRSGSDRGHGLLQRLDAESASPEDMSARDQIIASSISKMTRSIAATEIPLVLAESIGSKRWNEIADRCLACGNCTSVCPTCFCASFEHTNGLDDDFTLTKRWDSCFDTEHSYIHGGYVRSSTSSKYRQWMTHKLSTWVDQFGEIGCVGCGRCITWCPVGIDITEEAKKITDEIKQ